MHSAPRAHARRGESEVRRAGAGSPALLAPSGRDSSFRGLRVFPALRPFTKADICPYRPIDRPWPPSRSHARAREPGGGAGAPGFESSRACRPRRGNQKSDVQVRGAPPFSLRQGGTRPFTASAHSLPSRRLPNRHLSVMPIGPTDRPWPPNRPRRAVAGQRYAVPAYG